MNVLDVARCSQLQTVTLSSPVLQRLNIEGTQIPLDNLENTVLNPFELEQLQSQGLFLPWQQEALEKFPFLVTWLPHYSRHLTQMLVKAIQVIPKQKLWTQLTEAQKERFSLFLDSLKSVCKQVPNLMLKPSLRNHWPRFMLLVPPSLRS